MEEETSSAEIECIPAFFTQSESVAWMIFFPIMSVISFRLVGLIRYLSEAASLNARVALDNSVQLL